MSLSDVEGKSHKDDYIELLCSKQTNADTRLYIDIDFDNLTDSVDPQKNEICVQTRRRKRSITLLPGTGRKYSRITKIFKEKEEILVVEVKHSETKCNKKVIDR
jgi:hypothetical protein